VVTARVASAIASSSGTFTSLPTPKQKTRRLCGLLVATSSRRSTSRVLPDGRQAVGQEQHERQRALERRRGQRLLQRIVQVRATHRPHVLEPGPRRRERARVLLHGLRERHADVVAVVEQLDTLARCQAFEHLQRRSLGLLELAPCHAARAIEHERDLARQGRASVGPRRARSNRK
jgi:hypothetical protein